MAGSISHTRGYCVAVAGTGSHALGIDVELIERMKPSIERRILVDAEQSALVGLTEEARRRQVTTIFAAKEAFYKAHYEIDARYLGFDAVTVTLHNSVVRFDVGSGAVDGDLLERVQGRARVDDGRAIVGVVIDTGRVGRSATLAPVTKLVIIGGGPAGNACATYAARFGAEVGMIEDRIIGGSAHLLIVCHQGHDRYGRGDGLLGVEAREWASKMSILTSIPRPCAPAWPQSRAG